MYMPMSISDLISRRMSQATSRQSPNKQVKEMSYVTYSIADDERIKSALKKIYHINSPLEFIQTKEEKYIPQGHLRFNLGIVQPHITNTFTTQSTMKITFKILCSKRKCPVKLSINLIYGELFIYVCRDYPKPTSSTATQKIRTIDSGELSIHGGYSEKIFSCESLYISIETKVKTNFQFHYYFIDYTFKGNKHKPTTSRLHEDYMSDIDKIVKDIRERRMLPTGILERAKSVRIKRRNKLFAEYKCADMVKKNVDVSTSYGRFLQSTIDNRSQLNKKSAVAKIKKNYSAQNALAKSILSQERWTIKTTLHNYINDINQKQRERVLLKETMLSIIGSIQYLMKVSKLL